MPDYNAVMTATKPRCLLSIRCSKPVEAENRVSLFKTGGRELRRGRDTPPSVETYGERLAPKNTRP